MRPNLLMLIIVPLSLSCQSPDARKDNDFHTASNTESNDPVTLPRQVIQTPLPPGYQRTASPENSFASWLRLLPLKADSRVFLYNGDLKDNQSAQFAVLDIPVRKKDLQQCADAVMRLRAQYLFDQRRYTEISFMDNNGRKYEYMPHAKESFDRYLERVFSFCGTLSLEKQLKKTTLANVQPGDVLIKGGSPGHAVIVVDVAVNSEGKRIFMLAQSYMPAQDIHILRNPARNRPDPWYQVTSNPLINTPEWTFETTQLRTW